jgi:hypothetical protein
MEQITMEPGAVISMRGKHGVRVTCRSGVVWVAHDSSRLDHVLSNGEQYLSRQPGDAWVTALEAASVLLQTLSAPAAGARPAAQLNGLLRSLSRMFAPA